MAALSILPVPYHRPPNKNTYIDHLYGGVMKRHGVRVYPFEPGAIRLPLTAQPLIIHVHWPEAIYNLPTPTRLLRTAYFNGLVQANSMRGGKLLWTVHNMDFHKPAGELRHPQKNSILLRKCNGFVFLNADTPARFFQRYPFCRERPYRVIPHGLYLLQPSSQKKNPEPTFLLAGSVREYKGYADFARLFSQMKDTNLRLKICGAPIDEEETNRLRNIATKDSRIHLDLRFIPEQELADAAAAAHLCVLPYRKIENSGVALFALSAGTPVLLPDMPVFREIRQNVGASWVRLFEPPLTADNAVQVLKDLQQNPPTGSPDLSRYQWEHIADEHQSLYRELLDLE